MTSSVSTTTTDRHHATHVRAAFRRLSVMLGCYLALSLATLAVAAILRGNSGEVTSAVWVRAIIVAASAVVTCVFARSAARGSRRGLLRLRIVSAIMLVAVIVIVALPGAFPMWFRVEQALCGLVLLGVVIITNRRPIRTAWSD